MNNEEKIYLLIRKRFAAPAIIFNALGYVNPKDFKYKDDREFGHDFWIDRKMKNYYLHGCNRKEVSAFYKFADIYYKAKEAISFDILNKYPTQYISFLIFRLFSILEPDEIARFVFKCAHIYGKFENDVMYIMQHKGLEEFITSITVYYLILSGFGTSAIVDFNSKCTKYDYTISLESFIIKKIHILDTPTIVLIGKNMRDKYLDNTESINYKNILEAIDEYEL